MPKVGKKEFGYGPAGKRAAEKEAARTGQKVVKKKNPGYVVAHKAYADLGKLIADSNDPEGAEAWKDFWADKDKAGEKPKSRKLKSGISSRINNTKNSFMIISSSTLKSERVRNCNSS